jgi:hypothetical protein
MHGAQSEKKKSLIIQEETDVTVFNQMTIKPDTESNKIRQLVNLPEKCLLRSNLCPLFVPLHDVTAPFFICTMLTE